MRDCVRISIWGILSTNIFFCVWCLTSVSWTGHWLRVDQAQWRHQPPFPETQYNLLINTRVGSIKHRSNILTGTINQVFHWRQRVKRSWVPILPFNVFCYSPHPFSISHYCAFKQCPPASTKFLSSPKRCLDKESHTNITLRLSAKCYKYRH